MLQCPLNIVQRFALHNFWSPVKVFLYLLEFTALWKDGAHLNVSTDTVYWLSTHGAYCESQTARFLANKAATLVSPTKILHTAAQLKTQALSQALFLF